MEKKMMNSENKTAVLPKKFKSPKLIALSKSANLKNLECLAAKGSSCTWK